MRRWALGVTLLLGLAGSAPGATIHLSVPSEGETVLAPLRDFYVLGSFDRQGKTPEQEPRSLRADLFREGEVAPLRTLWASVDATGLTPREALRVDYLRDLAARRLGNLDADSDAPVLRCPPPDIRWDPGVPGSLEDPRLKGVAPGCRVVMVTMHARLELVAACFRAGAMGYVVKDSAASSLVAAIEATAAELKCPVLLEGYEPPADPRLLHFRVTPDPGVIEVNIHPAASWDELVERTESKDGRRCEPPSKTPCRARRPSRP